MTKLIVFDLDGTLAKSKSPMDEEMSVLLGKLLGSSFSCSHVRRLIQPIPKAVSCKPPLQKELLKKLYLFPTCSTAFYRFDNEWKEVYSEKLSKEQKEIILTAFEKALKTTKFNVINPYGEIIEDRGSQITFSALGQQAPLELKKNGILKQKEIKDKRRIR